VNIRFLGPKTSHKVLFGSKYNPILSLFVGRRIESLLNLELMNQAN